MAKKRKRRPLTPEQRQKKRESDRRHAQSPKGIETQRRYQQTPDSLRRRKEQQRLYRQLPRVREQRARSLRKYHEKIRRECLVAYGGDPPICACQRCPDRNNISFLTLDHGNNDGYLDRSKRGSGDFFRKLKKVGFPKDLGIQVLCFNCNGGREMNGGVCPHITKITRPNERKRPSRKGKKAKPVDLPPLDQGTTLFP